MMKKIFCLFSVMLMMIFAASALAADVGGDPLTLEEIKAWADEMKAMAMKSAPLNDPTEAAAFSEDGYCFIYEFGNLYMDRPEMTEDARINTFVVYSSEESTCLRNVQTDYLTVEVLNAFYSDNPDLMGTDDYAVLYLIDEMPEKVLWAGVQRDGQRIQTIEYAAHEKNADGTYSNAGLIYTIQDNLVSAIRVYGLNTTMTADEVNAETEELRAVAQATDYAQVKSSLIGTELDQFGRDDLIFSGIDFLTSDPDDVTAALGTLMEDNWMEDDTGEFLRFMEFDRCTLTFVYDANKENPVIDNISINYDGMEGPRAVRIGDTLSSVLNRFRNGEGSYDDQTGIESLYGDGSNPPYGTAEYGNDGTSTLRYVMEEDGRIICMNIFFEQMYASDITIYAVR